MNKWYLHITSIYKSQMYAYSLAMNYPKIKFKNNSIYSNFKKNTKK